MPLPELGNPPISDPKVRLEMFTVPLVVTLKIGNWFVVGFQMTSLSAPGPVMLTPSLMPGSTLVNIVHIPLL